MSLQEVDINSFSCPGFIQLGKRLSDARTQALHLKAARCNHRASKHLRRVWYGGILDLSLRVIIQRICRVRRLKNQLQWRPLANTSLQKLRKNLRDLDFTEIAPWKSKTKVKQVKPDDQTLDLSRRDKQDQDLQKHISREAYRRVHFRKWTQQKKRDARELRTHHSEDDLMKYYVNCEVKDLRHLLHIQPLLRSLILGSFYSPAALAAGRQQDVTEEGQCPYCKCTIGTLQHVVWECPQNKPPNLNPRILWEDVLDGVLSHSCITTCARPLKEFGRTVLTVLTLTEPDFCCRGKLIGDSCAPFPLPRFSSLVMCLLDLLVCYCVSPNPRPISLTDVPQRYRCTL